MAGSSPVDPSELEQTSFEQVRRGYDPVAVQRVLQRVAEEIRDLQHDRAELQARLAEFESAPAEALEAHRIAEALGSEAATVLEAAHAAATERVERAERDGEQLRADAESDVEQKMIEAVAAREEVLADAARRAEEVVEDGRQRGREMVNEAQVVRERMLTDLARKRQTGRAQVEQLRAGRDRLLEALTVAQQSLDVALQDLLDAVPEARGAAERAGLRVVNEPRPTVEELENEIEAARMVGHPLVEGVADPASATGPLDDPSDDPVFITAEMEALTHLEGALEAPTPEPAPDAESEDEADAEASAEPEPEDDVDTEPDDSEESEPEPEPEDDDEPEAEPEPEEEPEPEPETAPESESEVGEDDSVGDLFARLRDSQPEDDEEEEPSPAAASEDEASAEASDDQESPEPDPNAAVRDRVVSVVTRALKKVVVEEQGTLLDGIRRSGGEAVSVVVEDADAHAAAYEAAATPGLMELIEALGGTKADLAAGFGELRSIGLDPVRQRLLEVVERSDDADALSDTVRGLYRESRSRRIPLAAEAAVSAVAAALVEPG
ncbi:MAG: DivIVA domain-containing protein [Acidimicrobiales bacterium]